MDRRFFSRAGFGLVAGIATLFAGTARAADDDDKDDKGNKGDKGDKDDDDSKNAHKVVIQVSSGDRQTQQLALGNAANYAAYYKGKNIPYQIAIVTFGPGYQMVRADMSMVKGDVESLQKELGGKLTVYACQNTRRAIAESEGKKPDEIAQVANVEDTPSGIVRCAEMQQDGWSYIRP